MKKYFVSFFIILIFIVVFSLNKKGEKRKMEYTVKPENRGEIHLAGG